MLRYVIRLSPKSSRKDRSRGLRSKRERPSSPSPAPRESGAAHRHSSSSSQRPVQEAMSPSLAQCMRAVFAAFMWHEGIVHDAMACASFLKFHPKLPKQRTLTVTAALPAPEVTKASSESGSLKKDSLSRGSSKKSTPTSTPSNSLHRHSRNSSASSMSISDVSNINMTPSSTPSSSLKKQTRADPQPSRSESAARGADTPAAAGTNLNMNETIKTSEQAKLKDSKKPVDPLPAPIVTKSASSSVSHSDLPPTLEYLVAFWDEISDSTLQVVNGNLITPSATTAVASRLKKNDISNTQRMKREEKKVKRRMKDMDKLRRDILEAHALDVMERDRPPARNEAGNPMMRDTACELCGGMFSHPVTYHMRETHPGCGRHAGGQGYNSGGNFCGGWAGNCGDGGVGGSTWYLMCDRCRDKYLREKKQQTQKDKIKKKLKKKTVTVKQAAPVQDICEPHLIMKNNALFLLNLASSAGCQYSGNTTGYQYDEQTIPAPTKLQRNARLDSSLPSVNEDMRHDVNAFPAVPFTYLSLRGAQVRYQPQLLSTYHACSSSIVTH